jgi:hypothetical protein
VREHGIEVATVGEEQAGKWRSGMGCRTSLTSEGLPARVRKSHRSVPPTGCKTRVANLTETGNICDSDDDHRQTSYRAVAVYGTDSSMASAALDK